MSEFSCSICHYLSPFKANVKTHILNKNLKCASENPEILEIPVDIICEFCSKEFATMPSMKRHLKTCKVKKSSLEEEVQELKIKLAAAEAKSTTTMINSNNTNTINININLTPYNDPNLEGAERYYKEAIKKLFLSVPHIIERIHFNSELPENHNICIKNFRTKIAKAWNGREWKTMDEDELIKKLVNTYEKILEDWAEDNPERMKHIEKYNEIKERDGRQKVEQEIREEVKKLLYDKRGMIRIKN